MQILNGFCTGFPDLNLGSKAMKVTPASSPPPVDICTGLRLDETDADGDEDTGA